MTDETRKIRDELAAKVKIYEPKYGGKDHSGYDTLMLYEVNWEREECFIKGFDAGYALAQKRADAILVKELERIGNMSDNEADGCQLSARDAVELWKQERGG